MDDGDGDLFGNPLTKRPTWMDWATGGNQESVESGDDHNGSSHNRSVESQSANLTPPSSTNPTSPPDYHCSMSESPSSWHTPFQKARPGLITVIRCALAANTQLCIVLICFCCSYAYIVSMSKVYNEHDIWQACLVRTGQFEQKTDLSFVQAAAALGLQVVVYSFASMGLSLHALQHPALLPSTIPMVIYDLLAMLSFFSLQHIIPWPTQLEATAITMTKYVHSGMYKDLAMGAGICDSAYRFNQVYVLLIYSCAGLVTVVLLAVVWASHLHSKTAPSMARFGPSLKATAWPVFLSRVALAGYVVQLVAKNASASLAVDTFQTTLAPTYFPAAVASLDPTTICLVLTSMAVKRGTLARSSSAFRLGACAGVVYLATTWPGMVGAFSAIVQYELFTYHGCQTFFEGQVAWGQPDESEANRFCSYTRASFIGEAMIFVAMHAQVIACVLCFSSNRKRDLGAFNLSAPSNAQDLLFNRKPGDENYFRSSSNGSGYSGSKLSSSSHLPVSASDNAAHKSSATDSSAGQWNDTEGIEVNTGNGGVLSRVFSWGGSAATPEAASSTGGGDATNSSSATIPFPARAFTYDSAHRSSSHARMSYTRGSSKRNSAAQNRLLTGFE